MCGACIHQNLNLIRIQHLHKLPWEAFPLILGLVLPWFLPQSLPWFLPQVPPQFLPWILPQIPPELLVLAHLVQGCQLSFHQVQVFPHSSVLWALAPKVKFIKNNFLIRLQILFWNTIFSHFLVFVNVTRFIQKQCLKIKKVVIIVSF